MKSPLWRRLPRELRHLWLDAADARRALPPEALARLEAAVQGCEARHLGELRLCVEGGLPWGALRAGLDARQRAIGLFSQLRVWDTAHNNGVLIYLLLADQRIEVVADRGVSAHVPQTTWQALADDLGALLHQGRIEQGLLDAIARVGELLRQHHPAPDGLRHPEAHPNELPDAVLLL
ncbi:MAG: TPM domain-containing protein [Proteobacteria bacterium]|uniref:TPM domain-containing protein n=1 Tax=Aquabacterium sp. TaxID=1872578 RepID=UPI0035C6BE7B|nr:TPM domain-containing protein [Pseudomonadota bacterium]